jgi:uncharacterized protein
MKMHTNKLIHETSPYLLQHAHNPVDWHPWGAEALEKARVENKPILVSIGYAACHWCHVMERESFEDDSTAQIMNEKFVNIKIDREERPDLDHIYMDAVQAMTGHGGWPLNVFLTPEGKPFYGGTYFPPRRAFNKASWKEILSGISEAFNERRNEIDAQAETLTQHLLQSNSFGQQDSVNVIDSVFDKKYTDEAFKNSLKTADKIWGGFGAAPKFPQTFTIQFLLRYHGMTRNEEALKQALLSLDKMIEGGIYDQVGGGFARYSTDTEWLAPHFEKMLYDNALIISVLSEAFQLTKKERYKEVITETMNFVKRELLYHDNGFYSALDADSEGEEGKFYVWKKEEVYEILEKDAPLFCEYYNIMPAGNWEGKNILRVLEPVEIFAAKKGISADELKKILQNCRTKLLSIREKRARPQLDDKIILGWNALMNTACSKAYAATGNEEYKLLAERNIQFLIEKFVQKNSKEFYHTWKNDKAKYPAFLDDYAFFIQALINLHEITANKDWLLKAKEITEFVIENFSEEETGFFFFTNRNQKDIILRKKEVYDGAVPSGNSVMAYNLHYLSIVFDIKNWRQRSDEITASLARVITGYPTSFGTWGCLFMEKVYGTNELVILGKDYKKFLKEVIAAFIPHKVLISLHDPDQDFPILKGKDVKGATQIFLCKDYTCLAPFFSLQDLLENLKGS